MTLAPQPRAIIYSYNHSIAAKSGNAFSLHTLLCVRLAGWRLGWLSFCCTTSCVVCCTGSCVQKRPAACGAVLLHWYYNRHLLLYATRQCASCSMHCLYVSHASALCHLPTPVCVVVRQANHASQWSGCSRCVRTRHVSSSLRAMACMMYISR